MEGYVVLEFTYDGTISNDLSIVPDHIANRVKECLKSGKPIFAKAKVAFLTLTGCPTISNYQMGSTEYTDIMFTYYLGERTYIVIISVDSNGAVVWGLR